MQIGAAGLSAALVPSVAGILARRTSLEIIPPFLVMLLGFALSIRWERKGAGA